MDCRFHLKATFSVYGSEDCYCDMSCNWDGDAYGDDVDSRIKAWFLDCYHVAKAAYDEKMWELDRERREKSHREFELSELKRLKEKYPDSQ